MVQKLIVDKDYTLEEIHSKVENGAKFVVFQYCVSLVFAVSLIRLSPAIFIEKEEDIAKYKRKYNLISYICGWWCIPWGPMRTYKSLNVNDDGGLDVTEDVLLNLTEEGIKAGEFEFVRTNQIFAKPDKYEDHDFKKVAKKLQDDSNIEQIIIGLYVNTGDEKPYHTVGLVCQKDFDAGIQSIYPLLKKKFRPKTPFEFLDLTEDNEINTLLKKQGVRYK